MSTQTIQVWAPATVANWGPGYDLMGAAIEGLGDTLHARLTDDARVCIEAIHGDGGKLPTDANENTAGIAAQETLKLLGRADQGLALSLYKGLPLGSGLGSSGASAAAAAYAVNALCGSPLSKQELMPALLAAESKVSGWHGDNVAPALLGGFVMIYSYDPLSMLELPTPEDLHLALVTPELSIQTRDARAVVPKQIPMAQHIANSGSLGALVSALYRSDVALLGRALDDRIVVPARTPLLKGFVAVQRAALEAGAYGCSISGGGPTVFAVCDSPDAAQRAADAMQAAFRHDAGLQSRGHVARIDTRGTRELE